MFKQHEIYLYSQLLSQCPLTIAWRVNTVGHLTDTGIVTLGDDTCLVLTPSQNQKPPHKHKRAAESKECSKVVEEAGEVEFNRFLSITQRARDCCSHLMDKDFIIECN